MLPDVDQETLTNVANALGMEAFDPARVPPAVLGNLALPRNSNDAFGYRMTAWISGLASNPVPFNPNYVQLYENLLGYSSSINPQQALSMTGYLGLDKANGFLAMPQVAGPTTLPFPEQDAIDLSAQHGWYYIVGTLQGEDGHEYGMMYLLRTVALIPQQQAYAAGLTDLENQVSQINFELAQAGGRRYLARPIAVAGTTGLLEYKRDQISARVGVNKIESVHPGELFPMKVETTGWDYSQGDGVKMEVDLTFISGAPDGRFLQGAEGCLPCCGGVGSKYYSLPQIKVGEGSTITFGGKKVHVVGGTLWLDHQWGTGGNVNITSMRAFQNTQTPHPGGWDWFAVNFDEGDYFSAFSPHSAEFSEFYGVTGPTPPGTMTVPVSGKYVDADGNQSNLNGTVSVTEWLQETYSPDPSEYIATGTWYPNRWELDFPTLSTNRQRLILEPQIDQLSTLFTALAVSYQEAPVYVLNRDNGARVGTGVGESTGYDNSTTISELNRLEFANLPPEPDRFALPGPSSALVSESEAYLEQPQNKESLEATLGLCFEAGLDQFPTAPSVEDSNRRF